MVENRFGNAGCLGNLGQCFCIGVLGPEFGGVGRATRLDTLVTLEGHVGLGILE